MKTTPPLSFRRPASLISLVPARFKLATLAVLLAVAASAQDFQINSLTANNPTVIEVNSLTGDDRGGIAASGSHVFLTGDASTARFTRAGLSSGAPLGTVRDGLVADLKMETVYLLANGTTPLAPYNVPGPFTVNALVRLDGLTGLPDGTVINLSVPITVPGNDSSTVGIFAGWGRVVIHNGTRVYEISLPSGTVSDLGAVSVPQRTASESWAYWGVAETIGGVNYLAYVRNSTTIARTRVSDGTVTTVATFANLGDMASFTVVPSLNRWYFHHESGSQFGSFAEALGFADAAFTTPANPPVISSQPQSVTVITTEAAAFTVAANGTQPLAYQWRKAGADILDATNSTYTIASSVAGDAGSYTVIITNVQGAVTSAPAALTLEAVTTDLFKITSLRTNNFFIVDPLDVVGDDRGGLVASDSRVFLRGDDSVGSFNVTNLGSAVRLGTNDGALTVFFKYDSLLSDLRSQKVYILGNGTTPITETGGTATTLIEIHGSNGVPVGPPITLSSSIALGSGGLYTANVGLFSGWGRLVIHNGANVYSIDPVSGAVADLGAMARPARMVSESWAYWGVAEYWGGSVRLVYARDAQSIVRTAVPGGATEAVGSFANLNDLASFTVVPGMNHWYFHNETVNQFSTYNNYGGELLGYADASFIYQAPSVGGVTFSTNAVTVLEDSGAATVPGLVTTGAPSGTATFTVANSENSLFSVQPAVSPVGTLTFTPAANANGPATVTVTARDAGGASLGSNTFALTVTPMNDAPVPAFATNAIVMLEDFSILYWTNFVTATTGPANEGSQAIIGFTVGNDNNPLFGFQPGIGLDGMLFLMPSPNSNGTAIVTVITQDDGGEANGGMDRVTNTFSVTVIAVNDAPTVTLTTNNVVVAEDSGAYSANVFASTSVGPPDEVAAPQSLTNVTILSVTNAGLFSSGPTLALDGTLTFTPAANTYGTALVTFTAQDNGGASPGVDKATNTFIITVTAVNDAPDFALAPVGREGTVVAWGKNDSGQITVPGAPLRAVGLSANADHTLALKADGTVVAWGRNDFGQTTVPGGLSGVATVIAGGDHSLALKSDGTVVAWGRNQFGQTDVPAGLNRVVAISAGVYHNLALRNDGTVVAWGANNVGQATVPPGLNGVVAVEAGHEFNLALLNDGTVVAWGENTYHETEVPAGLNGVVAIAAGGQHALALKSDGTVVAWGRNTWAGGPQAGQVGLTETPSGLGGVVAITANGEHNLALKSDGTVVAWGRNYEGQTSVPAGLGGVMAVSAGYYHSVALADATGSPQVTVLEDAGPQTVVGMARNISAGLSEAASQSVSFIVTNDNNALFSTQPFIAASGTLTFTPAANSNGTAIVTVIAVDDGGAPGVSNSAPQTFTITVVPVNDAPTFALGSEAVTNQTVLAWGGQSQTSVPAGLTGVTAVAVSYSHTLALKGDGTVTAWGDNAYGRATVPAGLTGVTAVAAGYEHSLALRSDGTLAGWGNNYPYAQATPPAGLSGVIAIAAGRSFNLALKSDGTVVEWGYVGYSETGLPPGLNGVTAIAAGFGHRLALKSDGAVVAWGANDYGVLNVPSGLSGVIAIAAGDYHSLALKNDGTVVAWGNNSYGQTAVPTGLIGVTRIAAGGAHSLALMSNGRVTGWGLNHLSQTTHPSWGSGVTVISAGGYSSVAVGDIVAGSPFAVTVQKDSGPQSVMNAVTNVSAGPPDEAAQVVSFTVTNNNNALFSPGGQPAIDASGTLTFTPAPGAAGLATVTVIATDNGGTANGGVDTSGPRTFAITIASVKVFVSGSPVVVAGDSVSVPISLAGDGVESGVSFTLTYDRPRLTFDSVTVEPGSGLTLNWNEPSASMNMVGIVVSKPAGTAFPAGTNVMLRVTFRVPAGTAATNTPLGFSSAVVVQQVSDVSANPIPYVLYVPGSVTITTISTLEGDVSPRPAGSGAVTVSDAVQIGLFAASINPITDFGAGSEFQRADCAPRGSLGDGQVTLIDWVQALRYAAGLDPATTVGGPTMQAASLVASSARLTAGSRVVRVASGNLAAGRANTVSVQLDAQGNEAGVSLSVSFDPTALAFVNATVGGGASGGSLAVNDLKAAAGRVGLVLVMPAGTGIAAGPRDIITLTFNVANVTGSTAISVSGDTPVRREVADVGANELGASFVDGSFNLILPPGLKAAGLERAADGSLRLVVVNSDGSPVTAAQAARYEVHVTSDLGGAWSLLPNALVVENGALKIVDPTASGAGLRLYRLVESP